jgi:hypothetical protein
MHRMSGATVHGWIPLCLEVIRAPGLGAGTVVNVFAQGMDLGALKKGLGQRLLVTDGKCRNTRLRRRCRTETLESGNAYLGFEPDSAAPAPAPGRRTRGSSLSGLIEICKEQGLLQTNSRPTVSVSRFAWPLLVRVRRANCAVEFRAVRRPSGHSGLRFHLALPGVPGR